jgi:hypothetical protein
MCCYQFFAAATSSNFVVDFCSYDCGFHVLLYIKGFEQGEILNFDKVNALSITITFLFMYALSITITFLFMYAHPT